MKPFDELTYPGKVHKFRLLAKAALDAYGLGEARFKLVRIAGNAVFRVFASETGIIKEKDELYEKGQYLLRIHDKREQATDAIKLEMEWLKAIRRDANLPVPEPMPALDGNLLIQVSIPGGIGKRDCTLLRWMKGRYVTKRIRPYHFRAQGQIMAQLHNQAAQWQPPRGLTKRHFDWGGLFEDDAGAGLPNSEAWPLLPRKYKKPFEFVAKRTKQVMNSWGKAPKLYGLIHADCGVDANVLFHNGKARIIDFDGSGFGYYIYDLALALEHCWDEDLYPRYREALLKGYSEYRLISDKQLKYLELFLSAFYVYMSLWATALAHLRRNPERDCSRFARWRERGLTFVEKHITSFK